MSSSSTSLTGLAEYRNGGFVIDIGLIGPRDRDLPRRPHAVGASRWSNGAR